MDSFYKVREFADLREMLDQTKVLFGERNAFEIKRNHEHHFISYNEYIEKIDGMSTALISDGLAGGERVAIVADNCYEYCLTYLAVICSGGVVVPVDKELSEDDIVGILNTAEAKALICDIKALERLNSSVPDGVRTFCINKQDDCPYDADSFDDFVAYGINLNKQGKTLYRDVVQDTEKLCTLLFTSGTTGTSKGVMLCQRNYVFEIRSAMGIVKIKPEDCGISLLPLHHTFESSIMVFFAPYCGAKVTFCEGFKYVLRNMKEFNPSVFVAVPLLLETVHKRILKEIGKQKFGNVKFKVGKAVCKGASKVNIDLKKVLFKEIQHTFGGNMRLIICGGAPIDPQIIKDFDAFGIQVIFGYGLTECAPLVLLNHDRLRTTDSVGRSLPGSETKIINPDENGIGEICTRGDMVMLGYYKNQEETDKVIDQDGWFHTGDLGFIDRRGCYHLTGRCKNVIVTKNGKNIYPEELEYHLKQDRFIAEAMVEGIPNSQGDLTVQAQIYPDIGEITEYLDKEPSENEIKALMKTAVDAVNNVVPGFKRIKKFLVRDKDFEMTTTKKIKRNANKTKDIA